MRSILQLGMCFVVFALAGTIAKSAEIAVLRNGFVVRLDHRETRGEVVRFYVDKGSENYVDVRLDDITSFEEQVADPPDVIPPAPVRPPSLEEAVASASRRYGVDADVLYSVIRAESAFNPAAVSPKGALGLMQLMPETATRMGIENRLDASANVDAGTHYLRILLAYFHGDLIKALAAYNAGPERVRQFHGVPPYPETIAYINRVLQGLNERKLLKPAIARRQK